jgi:hypothetical protein
MKKVTGTNDKELRTKRLKLKSLHKRVGASREELEQLPPSSLPPASSGNAARQVRSRLKNTFPVDWLALHLDRREEDDKPGTER